MDELHSQKDGSKKSKKSGKSKKSNKSKKGGASKKSTKSKKGGASKKVALPFTNVLLVSGLTYLFDKSFFQDKKGGGSKKSMKSKKGDPSKESTNSKKVCSSLRNDSSFLGTRPLLSPLLGGYTVTIWNESNDATSGLH